MREFIFGWGVITTIVMLVFNIPYHGINLWEGDMWACFKMTQMLLVAAAGCFFVIAVILLLILSFWGWVTGVDWRK